MTTMTTEKPRFAIKEPRKLSARVQLAAGLLLRGGAAQVEQRVHLVDHGHAVGLPVQRAVFLHRPGNLLLHPHLPLLVQADWQSR